MEKKKHLGLVIEAPLHAKLVYIAKYEGRSISGQVMHLIQNCVRQFEQKHGEIKDEIFPLD